MNVAESVLNVVLSSLAYSVNIVLVLKKKKKRKIVKLVKRNVWHVKRKSTDSMKKYIYNEKLFFFTLRTCAHCLLNHFTIQQVSSFVCSAAFCNVASAHSKLCT